LYSYFKYCNKTLQISDISFRDFVEFIDNQPHNTVSNKSAQDRNRTTIMRNSGIYETLASGFYAESLTDWYNAFDKESIKIVFFDDLKRNRELLLSIKGIGEVTSRYLVAEIYAGRFRSASQCAAYMGLVPVPKQSGQFESVSLSRAGNKKLKAKLYMAAISAKRFNPVLKEHYDRLIARGKCKMSALCAVMRRLVQISFGVIKHQKEFCLQVN